MKDPTGEKCSRPPDFAFLTPSRGRDYHHLEAAVSTMKLAIELPISTIVRLRSIADIARREDEDFRTIEAQLACLEVLALGGKEWPEVISS
jgi:hypothetical protein